MDRFDERGDRDNQVLHERLEAEQLATVKESFEKMEVEAKLIATQYQLDALKKYCAEKIRENEELYRLRDNLRLRIDGLESENARLRRGILN